MANEYNQDLKIANKLLFWEKGRPNLKISNDLILKNQPTHKKWLKNLMSHKVKYRRAAEKIYDDFKRDERRLNIGATDIIQSDSLWVSKYRKRLTNLRNKEEKDYQKMFYKHWGFKE